MDLELPGPDQPNPYRKWAMGRYTTRYLFFSPPSNPSKSGPTCPSRGTLRARQHSYGSSFRNLLHSLLQLHASQPLHYLLVCMYICTTSNTSLKSQASSTHPYLRSPAHCKSTKTLSFNTDMARSFPPNPLTFFFLPSNASVIPRDASSQPPCASPTPNLCLEADTSKQMQSGAQSKGTEPRPALRQTPGSRGTRNNAVPSFPYM